MGSLGLSANTEHNLLAKNATKPRYSLVFFHPEREGDVGPRTIAGAAGGQCCLEKTKVAARSRTISGPAGEQCCLENTKLLWVQPAWGLALM